MSGTPASFAQDCYTASRALRRLPADVKKAVKADVRAKVADPLARSMAAAAAGPYAAALAAGVKTRADVTPKIVVGGARKVASGGASVRQLVYGVEFGGGRRTGTVRRGRTTYRRRTTMQFTRAPFIYPTWDRDQDEVLAGYGEVLDTVLQGWASGG